MSYTRFKSMSFAKISSIVFQGYGYLSTAVVRCYSRNVLYIYIQIITKAISYSKCIYFAVVVSYNIST